jgi:hypothetical protein
MPRLAWTRSSLPVLPCVDGMIGTHHCAQPLVEGFFFFFFFFGVGLGFE